MIGYRPLEREELARVGEIDRTERIDRVYRQRGSQLEAVNGDFSATAWRADGGGEHSVAHQLDECERWIEAGGIALGAFDDRRLVGMGIVLPHLRPGIAQLTFLYVSDGFRDRGIGRRLSDELDAIARAAGDATVVVSATPSIHTVEFYRRRGYVPTASPLPELVALEPDDVHLEKRL